MADEMMIQDFYPVLDSNSLTVIHIDFAAHRINFHAKNGDVPATEPMLSAPTTAPPPLETDSLVSSGRARIPYPELAHEFLPDLLIKQPNAKISTRGPLKPLHILQPEGVSFTMSGNVLEWQKWKMHIGEDVFEHVFVPWIADDIVIELAFSHREGIALSTITYDDNGEMRPLLYRLSCVEVGATSQFLS